MEHYSLITQVDPRAGLLQTALQPLPHSLTHPTSHPSHTHSHTAPLTHTHTHTLQPTITTEWHFFPNSLPHTPSHTHSLTHSSTSSYSSSTDFHKWAQHLQLNLKSISSLLHHYESLLSPTPPTPHSNSSNNSSGSTHSNSSGNSSGSTHSNNSGNNSNIEVVKHPTEPDTKGFILQTKSNSSDGDVISQGTCIFTEEALVSISEQNIQSFVAIFQPYALQVISQIQSPSTREEVASFLLPGHCFALIAQYPSISRKLQDEVLNLCCPIEAFSRSIIESLRSLADLMTSSFTTLPAATILRLLVISSSNVFGDDDLSWLAWFRLGCRVNHSCLPNSSWSLTQPEQSSSSCKRKGNPTLVFTALCNIPPGTEITHSYLERERWYPRKRRQDTLFAARGFVCGCQDCSIAHKNSDCSNKDNKEGIGRESPHKHFMWDRKRVFACSDCGLCASVVISDKMMQCVACGINLGHQVYENSMQQEEHWVNVMTEVVTSNITDQAKYETMVQKANKVFHELLAHAPCHWVMIEIADFLQSYYTAIMTHLQQQTFGTTSDSIMARDIIILSKLLYLKHLRLNALNQCYPVRNSVEWSATDDIVIHIKMILGLMKKTKSRPGAKGVVCGDDLGTTKGYTYIDRRMSHFVLLCCRAVFCDSEKCLDVNVVSRSGLDSMSSETTSDQCVVVAVMLQLCLILDSVYKIAK